MPGQWLRVRDDPDYVLSMGDARLIHRGDLVECDLWEDGYQQRQGSGLFAAHGNAALGDHVVIEMVCSSGDY